VKTRSVVVAAMESEWSSDSLAEVLI